MKNALWLAAMIVLVLVAVAGGYLYGTYRYTGRLDVTELARIGTMARPTTGQFVRGQFNPGQLSPEQLQQMRQGRGTQGAIGGTGQTGTAGQAGVAFGGSAGVIESIEGNILTVRTQTGTIKVKATDTTLIEKNVSVEVQDLKVGEQVVISGSQGADGLMTARSIRVMTAPRP